MFDVDNHWLAGNVLKARQDGLFSTLTFTNLWRPEGTTDFEARYLSKEAYASEQDTLFIPDNEWLPYHSALRFPVSFFTTIDILHWKITGHPKNLIPFYKTVTTFLLIFILLLFIVWINNQFGILTAFIFGITICYGNWLISKGDHLQAAIWRDLLPFIVGLHLFSGKYKIFNIKKKFPLFLYGFLSTALFASKSYEWLPTLMLSLLLPSIYYFEFKKEKIPYLIKTFFIISIGALSGFLFMFLIHFLSLAYVSGSFDNVLDHFNNRFAYRTRGNIAADNLGIIDKDFGGEYNIYQSKSKSVLNVLGNYFSGKPVLGSFTVSSVITLILLSIPSIFFKPEFFPKTYQNRTKLLKLLLLTTLALISSVAFFFVFKAHAVIHPHIDYIVFYYPFILIFIVYYAFLVKSLLLDLLEKIFNKRWSTNILYALAILPLFLSLNKKHQWFSITKLNFLMKDEIVFDLFSYNDNYSFYIDDKTTIIEENIITAKEHHPKLFLELIPPKEKDIIIKTKFHSNVNGKIQIFYDYCIKGKFIETKSITKRVSYGDNLLYIQLDPDKCVNLLRVDFLEPEGTIITLEELIIK